MVDERSVHGRAPAFITRAQRRVGVRLEPHTEFRLRPVLGFAGEQPGGTACRGLVLGRPVERQTGQIADALAQAFVPGEPAAGDDLLKWRCQLLEKIEIGLQQEHNGLGHRHGHLPWFGFGRKTRFEVRDPVGCTEAADTIEKQRWLHAILCEPCR